MAMMSDVDNKPAAGFGAVLRQFRVTAGLSQEALAERSGLSVDAISALEQGRRHHPGRAGSALACAVVISACAGGGVLAGRSGPGRSRAPAVTAPTANMPAVHQNAVS